MEILNKNTFDKWWRETLSFLKYKFRNNSHAECEDWASEAFYLLIKDAQSDKQKLTFSVNSLKLLAYRRAVDEWRKNQRRPPTNSFESIPPLSISGFLEQNEDKFESVVAHISALRPHHRLLLELKYKAVSRSQLENMTDEGVHVFMSKKYGDSVVAEEYGFKSPQSVRMERHRALNLLRESIYKSQQ